MGPSINCDQDDMECNDDDEQEVIKPVFRRLIQEPTQEETDEHHIDHAVFRSWYPHCIHGQSVSYPHKRVKNREYDIPIASTDYGYMNDDEETPDEK